MKKVLTIAGSDSGGGAGIQADIKTMTANGVYAMSAVTALTAQNTLGVWGISEVKPDFLKKQLDAVFVDLYPDAIKTGMIPSAELVRIIAATLKKYDAKNIVVDPVCVATSGHSLSEMSAYKALADEMFPLAEVITPNIPEAELIVGFKISDEKNMEKAALFMNDKFGCSVLLKGGHSINDANDVLCVGGSIKWFHGERVNNTNTHGTGCTLSSAIASNLAKGDDIYSSVYAAKLYISGALSDMMNLGSGSGPLNHGFDLKSDYI